MQRVARPLTVLVQTQLDAKQRFNYLSIQSFQVAAATDNLETKAAGIKPTTSNNWSFSQQQQQQQQQDCH